MATELYHMVCCPVITLICVIALFWMETRRIEEERKAIRYRNFIVLEHHSKHYQEWKKNNEGLI